MSAPGGGIRSLIEDTIRGAKWKSRDRVRRPSEPKVGRAGPGRHVGCKRGCGAGPGGAGGCGA